MSDLNNLLLEDYTFEKQSTHKRVTVMMKGTRSVVAFWRPTTVPRGELEFMGGRKYDADWKLAASLRSRELYEGLETKEEHVPLLENVFFRASAEQVTMHDSAYDALPFAAWLPSDTFHYLPEISLTDRQIRELRAGAKKLWAKEDKDRRQYSAEMQEFIMCQKELEQAKGALAQSDKILKEARGTPTQLDLLKKEVQTLGREVSKYKEEARGWQETSNEMQRQNNSAEDESAALEQVQGMYEAAMKEMRDLKFLYRLSNAQLAEARALVAIGGMEKQLEDAKRYLKETQDDVEKIRGDADWEPPGG